MGTDGARGLLFCVAKRSGAFPSNMPAGLRARVSRLGGFTRSFIPPFSCQSAFIPNKLMMKKTLRRRRARFEPQHASPSRPSLV
jgi:hypothetical protein